jgi:uncharacterized membrane protein YcaP (DUF421 family)
MPVLGLLSYYSPRFNQLLKGRPAVLAQDGHMLRQYLDKYLLTEGDLLEALRLKGNLANLSEAEQVNFERNGSISVVKKRESRVIEVAVEAGVQTIRLKIE